MSVNGRIFSLYFSEFTLLEILNTRKELLCLACLATAHFKCPYQYGLCLSCYDCIRYIIQNRNAEIHDGCFPVISQNPIVKPTGAKNNLHMKSSITFSTLNSCNKLQLSKHNTAACRSSCLSPRSVPKCICTTMVIGKRMHERERLLSYFLRNSDNKNCQWKDGSWTKDF